MTTLKIESGDYVLTNTIENNEEYLKIMKVFEYFNCPLPSTNLDVALECDWNFTYTGWLNEQFDQSYGKTHARNLVPKNEILNFYDKNIHNLPEIGSLCRIETDTDTITETFPKARILTYGNHQTGKFVTFCKVVGNNDEEMYSRLLSHVTFSSYDFNRESNIEQMTNTAKNSTTDWHRTLTVTENICTTLYDAGYRKD